MTTPGNYDDYYDVDGIINIMMIMMMIILTTPGDYDDYDSGDDYYFYDDGYRFVQLSIQN